MIAKSQFILALLTVIAGAAFWFSLQGAVVAGEGPLLFWALAIFSLHLAFLGLSFLLSPVWLPSAAVFLSGLAMLFFFELSSRSFLFILALSFLTLLPALRVRREAEARLTLSLVPVLRKGIPLFLTFAAFGFAVFLYPAEGVVGFKDILPERVFEQAFGLIGKSIPFDFVLPFPVPDLNKTVDEAILASLPKELGVDLSQILKPERERLLAEARAQLSKSLGVKIKGDIKVGEALYAYLIQSAEERFGGFKKYLPAVYTLGIFVILRSLAVIIGWASVLIAWLLVTLGLGAGILAFDERSLTQRYLRLN
ncbi:hypothetical protein HY406_00480 [Candidatus Giovannonibacteria bacterium]|nr:hypothetical protein [Candidatus Giovannonibacteria bacterium]